MPQLWLRRRGLLAALVVLGPALGGCSSPSLPSLPGWFGSSSSAAGDSSAAFTPPENFECPAVTVRSGAAALSISANPADNSAMSQRYQLSLNDTARECKIAGPTLTMKVGVRGRVIVGPAGGPGQVDVPVRFAVVREGVDPKTIVTKFQRIGVTIASGEPHTAFSIVEDDLTFAFPRGAEIDSYVVYVGFDPVSAQEMDKARRKPAPKPARPPRNTAQAPAQ
jgi:hypothetical protein